LKTAGVLLVKSRHKIRLRSKIYVRNPIADFVARSAMGFQHSDLQVYDDRGYRKYLDSRERRRFLAAADCLDPASRALCYVLAYSGCRISEALEMALHQLDLDSYALRFRTLKRRRLAFRLVPIPGFLIAMLRALRVSDDGHFWQMHRVTAWRLVREVMMRAQIRGPMATCKGLRHAFGIRAASRSVPGPMIQRWMGHASPATTAIYLDAVGAEERQFAKRMWG